MLTNKVHHDQAEKQDIEQNEDDVRDRQRILDPPPDDGHTTENTDHNGKIFIPLIEREKLNWYAQTEKKCQTQPKWQNIYAG